MSQINPFTGSILQAPHVQRQQAADKDRQVRKAHDQAKDAALADDRLEHQVESAEELQPIQRDDRRERHFQRSAHKHPPLVDEEDGQSPHIDLTA